MTNIIERRWILGVSGGIAAYKAAELARLMVRLGIEVQVVMSEAATRFVAPLTFQALTGRPVWTDLWAADPANGMPHIELAREAEGIVVAPASADLIAKVAQGHADDLLTTLIAARRCPLFLAPAMNVEMWHQPALQRNLELLRCDGVTLIGPDAGPQACGDHGMGRMMEPEAVLAELVALGVSPRQPLLEGRRVVVTAGPTQEALDPVRMITNTSSGRMGYALAAAARATGAEVVLVSGPTALLPPPGCRMVAVRSAAQMREAVLAEVSGATLFIAVAAVADYAPSEIAPHKIKKTGEVLHLDLLQTPDILADVAALKNAPFCIGFAAESEQLDQNADSKRRAKGVPLLVGNLVERALGQLDNEVTLYDDHGRYALPPAPKAVLARQIIEHALSLLPTWQSQPRIAPENAAGAQQPQPPRSKPPAPPRAARQPAREAPAPKSVRPPRTAAPVPEPTQQPELGIEVTESAPEPVSEPATFADNFDAPGEPAP